MIVTRSGRAAAFSVLETRAEGFKKLRVEAHVSLVEMPPDFSEYDTPVILSR